MNLAILAHVAAQILRCDSLADRTDIVLLALDGQEAEAG